MPRKLRELLRDLQRAGFSDRGGKASHRNLVHPKGLRVTLSGGLDDDAHRYQERDVKRAVESASDEGQ